MLLCMSPYELGLYWGDEGEPHVALDERADIHRALVQRMPVVARTLVELFAALDTEVHSVPPGWRNHPGSKGRPRPQSKNVRSSERLGEPLAFARGHRRTLRTIQSLPDIWRRDGVFTFGPKPGERRRLVRVWQSKPPHMSSPPVSLPSMRPKTKTEWIVFTRRLGNTTHSALVACASSSAKTVPSGIRFLRPDSDSPLSRRSLLVDILDLVRYALRT